MRRTREFLVVVGCLLAATASAQQQPSLPAVRPPVVASVAAAALPPFDQARAVADLQKKIAGKEDLPATEVFMNIQEYKGVTAGRLLRIMEYGFTRSLGVTCTHCHVAGDWESDDKPAKQIAREMSRMVGAINAEYLKKIPDLNSTNPSVNCTTCHRGQKRPALELPAAMSSPQP
jgi:hypothetical protein